LKRCEANELRVAYNWRDAELKIRGKMQGQGGAEMGSFLWFVLVVMLIIRCLFRFHQHGGSVL